MSVLSKEQVENIIQVYNIESLKDVHEAVKDIMKDVLQKTLEAELDVSIGYRKYERKEDDNSNVRNGSYTKNVNSTLGKIELSVPRDREGLHEPLLIKKGQSDISEIENKIISMYGKGMTTRDINDHMQDIYGVDISAEMVSKITDRLLPEIKSWQNRVLQPLYVILYIDAIQFNVKDNGKTVKKAIYIAQGIDADGMRDVLGIWVGNGAESSKYWLSVLTEIRNRGALDILITCIDGLSGFAEAINTVYPQSEIQRCIVHHIRYCCKFVNYKDRKSFCADMKTIYNAPTEEEALEALCKFSDKWRKTYGYVFSPTMKWYGFFLKSLGLECHSLIIFS